MRLYRGVDSINVAINSPELIGLATRSLSTIGIRGVNDHEDLVPIRPYDIMSPVVGQHYI